MILKTMKMIGRRGANHELPAARHPEEVNGLEETLQTEPELSRIGRENPVSCPVSC